MKYKTFLTTIQGISGWHIYKFDKFSFISAGAFRQNLHFLITYNNIFFLFLSFFSLSSFFISNCIVTNSCMGQATSTENTRSVIKNFHIVVVILKIEILTCFKSSWWNTYSYWICKHTNVDTTLKYIRKMPKWVIQKATSKVIGGANMEIKWTNPE